MKRIALIVIALACTLVLQAQDIQGFVNRQLQTYPKSRLPGIYKSCFQDFMGAKHLVSDRQRVKAYLDEELSTTTLDDLMPWQYEPCGIDSSYYRVSIRTVKEGIIGEDMLLDAFARSANRWSSERHQARLNGRVATEEGEANTPKRPTVEEWSKYAISHSPEYREVYRPHYRIVERGIFEHEILPLIEQKSMVVRIAEIEVYPEYLKEYLMAARNVGAESVRKESGVICIFPNQVRTVETKIRIVEIYRWQGGLSAPSDHATLPDLQTRYAPHGEVAQPARHPATQPRCHAADNHQKAIALRLQDGTNEDIYIPAAPMGDSVRPNCRDSVGVGFPANQNRLQRIWHHAGHDGQQDALCRHPLCCGRTDRAGRGS